MPSSHSRDKRTANPVPSLPPWLARIFPMDRCVVPVGDADGQTQIMHAVDHGPHEGPVVLMIHGNPTWSFLWRKIIHDLPEFRCLAPDLIGLGLSSKPKQLSWHTVQQHTASLRQFVTQMGIQHCILVAQDWGGPFALGLAASLPDLVQGLVLGNTAIAPLTRKSSTAFHRFARLPIVSDIVFRGLAFPQAYLAPVQGDRRSIAGTTAKAYRYPLRSYSDRIAPLALARLVPDGPQHLTTPTLEAGYAWARQFEGPVELVWGMNDPILKRALSRTRKTFRDVHVTKTDAGHFLQEEVSSEFVGAIRRLQDRIS